MVVRATLASLMLLTAQPPADVQMPAAVRLPAPVQAETFEDPHWLCIHTVESPQGRLEVTRGLDADGRPIYDYVGWLPRPRFGTSSVGWLRRGPIASPALPWTLQTDYVGTFLNLSRAARRPVWLVLRVDGRVAGRRLLFRQMSDLDRYDRQTLELSVNFRAHPPEAGRAPDVMPDLREAREAVLTAEEEGGETLARYVISLPAWSMVEQAVAGAVPDLDAALADYRTRCQEEGQPPHIQPMPAPVPSPG